MKQKLKVIDAIFLVLVMLGSAMPISNFIRRPMYPISAATCCTPLQVSLLG